MDAQTFAQVKQFIQAQYFIDITRYKEKQMLRRLNAWLRRSKVTTWGDYFRLVREDPLEEKRFRDYLTINVTSFFRDPERWERLEMEVLPQVMSAAKSSLYQREQPLKIWSAGCSIGAEPYSLAMMMERIAPQIQHDILATDFDRGALETARRGGPYSGDDVKNIQAHDLGKYFSKQDSTYFIADKLKKRIRFQEQDLLSDSFENGFHLIVCRNVVIYFTRQIKEELYRKFYRSLVPEGVLFLGGTEIIPQSQKIGFRNIGGSVYKKIEI